MGDEQVRAACCRLARFATPACPLPAGGPVWLVSSALSVFVETSAVHGRALLATPVLAPARASLAALLATPFAPARKFAGAPVKLPTRHKPSGASAACSGGSPCGPAAHPCPLATSIATINCSYATPVSRVAADSDSECRPSVSRQPERRRCSRSSQQQPWRG